MAADDWEVVDVTSPPPAGHSGNDSAAGSPTSNEWETVDLQQDAPAETPTQETPWKPEGLNEPQRGAAQRYQQIVVSARRSSAADKAAYDATQVHELGRNWQQPSLYSPGGYLPPRTDAAPVSEVAQQLPGEIGTQWAERYGGGEEYIGETRYRNAHKKMWQAFILPQAVRDWTAYNLSVDDERDRIDLDEWPPIVEYARRVGVRPDQFAADWPDYVNLSQEAIKANYDDSVQTMKSAGAQRDEGAKTRADAAQMSAAYRPKMDQWSPSALAFDMATSVPDILVAAGGTVAGGPGTGLALMGGTIAPGMYAQGRNMGLDHQHANGYAALMTMAEIAPELPVLETLAHTPEAKSLMRRMLGDFADSVGGKVAGTAALEGTSEMITEALQIAIENGTLDQHTSLPDALRQIARAGVVGVGPGAVAGGTHVGGEHGAENQATTWDSNQKTRPQPGAGDNAVPADEVLGPVEGAGAAPSEASNEASNEADWEVVDASTGERGGVAAGDAGDGWDVVDVNAPGDVAAADEQHAAIRGAPEDKGVAGTDRTGEEVAPVAGQESDPRLADEDYRSALEAFRRDIGQSEPPRLKRENGDEGAVTGISHVPLSEHWASRPTFTGPRGGQSSIGPKEAHEALDLVAAGKTDELTPRQRQYVTHTLDEIDSNRKAWESYQVDQAQRHEDDIRAVVPEFDQQDEVTQDLTMLAKAAAEHASEDEIEHALEAQDDGEAIRRLQKLIARGWQERPTNEENVNGETDESGQRESQPATPAAAVETAGEGQPGAPEAGGQDEVQAGSSAGQVKPATDLFGANEANLEALNKKNAKVERKLKGKNVSPETAPRGDIFREAAETERAAAASAQTDIEQAPAQGTKLELPRPEPRTDELGAAMDQAAASPTNDLPEPTPAQKEAGNYPKGHISLHGLDIAIENPIGSWRWKVDTDKLADIAKAARLTKDEKHIERAAEALRENKRVPEAFAALQRARDEVKEKNPKLAKRISALLDDSWAARLAADYGYIKGHIGKDKDHLDVYVDSTVLAKNPKNPVFVMDQKNTEGKFDEHKVFMGFANKERVMADYVKSFDNAAFARTIAGKLRRFATAEDFKKWLATGDLTKPVGEWKDVQRGSGSLEQGGEAATRQPVREEVFQPGSGRAGEGDGRSGGAVVEGQRDAGDSGVRNGGSAPVREGGDRRDVPAGSESATAPEGDHLSERSGDSWNQGVLLEHIPTAAVERTARKPADLEARRVEQRKADAYKVTTGDLDNIRKTLPFLLDKQQEDVKKAEDRHSKPDGFGIVFTNGTGTGKTYTGLGVIKRMVRQGKTNHLIVVPSQKIVDDWVKSGKNLGLEITPLVDTKDTGKGVAITTYANFGENLHLADRAYDSVLADEAHMLMQNEQAADTNVLEALRAITLHPDGWHHRAKMLHRDVWLPLKRVMDQIDSFDTYHSVREAVDKMLAQGMELPASLKKDNDRLAELFRGSENELKEDLIARRHVMGAKFDELARGVQRQMKTVTPAQRSRATFLSATPFAYEKNTKWAEGYLFEFEREDPGKTRAYNEPTGYEKFMVEHFGYRMRYNKLTEPDVNVDRTVMQRQFNSWLKQQGALSARVLEEPFDYDRKFVLVDSQIGNKIDEGMEWLRKNKLDILYTAISKRFDFLARSRLLEALKSREAVPYLKKQFALGRKVVVFYDFNEGGGFDVFNVNSGMFRVEREDERAKLEAEIQQFRRERPDLVALDTHAESPLVQLKKAFPDAVEYNGLHPAKKRTVWVNQFNDDNSSTRLILAQKSANAGWSAHDTTGKHSRVLINLGLPTAPVQAIQQEGRIYRVGQASDAMFRYFNTGTTWERTAFASTISRRASTAENLAMGEEARGLLDSFVEAFEDSAPEIPGGTEDGKGGKAKDRALAKALTPWDRARAFYFSQQKKTSKTKAAEGEDYYPTPEPLGLKMVEWAGVKPGDDLLEPSAGHGAIARFFPELNSRTVVEPSDELASKLGLATDAKLINGRFEDLNAVNKYDVVVMNPPFGHGGSTAIDHLDKVFTKHLREGGRVVALIPEGPAADKRFAKWYEETQGAHLVAEYGLPAATFQRAGTSVKTRVVVIDKVLTDEQRRKNGDYEHLGHVLEVSNGMSRREISGEDPNELFDNIEHVNAPPRVRDRTAERQNAEMERAAAAAEEAKNRKEAIKHGKKAGLAFTPIEQSGSFYAVAGQRVAYDEFVNRRTAAEALGGRWNGYGKVKGFKFDTAAARDQFIAKYNAAPAEVPFALRNGTAARTPVPPYAVKAHVEQLKKTLPLVDIDVVNGWNEITKHPALKEWLESTGVGNDGWGGVMWQEGGRRHIYVNARTVESLSQLEQTIFHEATHRGLRAALGDAAYRRMADYLFVQMGGAKGFAREMRLYFDSLGKKFDVNNQEHRFQLVDEALAGTAEILSRGETLPDKIREFVDRVLAWVNAFLRQNGWRRTFSRAEIYNAIRSARDIGISQSTRNDTIETPAREMAQHATKVQREVAARARPPVNAKTEGALQLKDDDEQLAERQSKLWQSLKQGQYIERAIRQAFLALPGMTLNQKGEWTPSPFGRHVARSVVTNTGKFAKRSFGFMRPLAEAVHRSVIKEYGLDQAASAAWEAAKAGLIDRQGTPPEFVLAEATAKNQRAQILDAAKRMVDDLEKSGMVSNRAEAEALQAVLNGETVPEEKIAAIAEPIRQLVDQWGAEAVELGMLDKATFERNRATYLHRVYRKHEADYFGASGVVRRVDEAMTNHRRKIIGNQFKRRGLSWNVGVEQLRKALPADWWGRKTDGKKIDVALGDTDWVVLSKIKNPREGTPDMLNGDMDGSPRVVDRAYWPAELELPQKFAGWRNDGTFRAIKVSPNEVTLWRDFTKDERTKMGEIRDVRYTFLKTALTAAHDLSTGRLFKNIAENEEWARDTQPTLQDGTPAWEDAQPLRRKIRYAKEWVRVPDTLIPGTSTKRYGAMSGKYILSSIWRDLNEAEIAMQPGAWKWALTQFKKNKTTRNPKTHLFNTMSNVILAYIDDMRFSDWVRGVKDWHSEGPMWKEAQLHGVFGHDFIDQEIKQNFLKPMLERILKEGSLDEQPMKKWKFLTRMFDGVRALDHGATWAYQAEDEIFRMASYMQARQHGMAPDEAAIHARRQFIDYDIRAPWINAMRASVVPFISYSYRAIPRVMEAVAKRPWKIATLALLTYAVNELAYKLMDDDDEDLQRRLMNENLRGYTWAFTPRMLRLPANDEYGNPVFLDLRNGLPAANIVDFDNSYSAVPTPAWVQLGGPLVMGVDFMQNYNAYRQEPITDREVDTTGQKAAKAADFLWSSYMPSWAPGGYTWDKVAKAAQGRMNQAHETSTIGMAIAQSVLPIRVESTEKNRRDRMREYERKLRKLEEYAGDLRRDFQTLHDKTPEDEADLREALAEIQSRKLQVIRERDDTLRGSD